MKVEELIEELEKCDPDEEVYLSIDPEGNHFRSVHEVDSNSAMDEHGDIYLRNLTDELEELGYSELDVAPDDAENVTVIWP